MADALRATRGVPGFHAALDLHLVDTNAPMREAQRAALQAYRSTWHERFDEVPEGPLLLVANEFFDALPVRQFHRTAQGWRERMVGLDEQGGLRLALAPGATPFAAVLPDAGEGAEAELSEAGRALAAAIGARIARDGGWALIVDYGLESAGRAASLQAVRGTRARASSTGPARPTSAPTSTSRRSPLHRVSRRSVRWARATSCDASGSPSGRRR